MFCLTYIVELFILNLFMIVWDLLLCAQQSDSTVTGKAWATQVQCRTEPLTHHSGPVIEGPASYGRLADSPTGCENDSGSSQAGRSGPVHFTRQNSLHVFRTTTPPMGAKVSATCIPTFPPLQKVVDKMREEEAEVILVAPNWPSIYSKVEASCLSEHQSCLNLREWLCGLILLFSLRLSWLDSSLPSLTFLHFVLLLFSHRGKRGCILSKTQTR